MYLCSGVHDRGFNFRQSTHILHVFRFASNNTAVRNERQRYPYIALLGDFSGLQKISVITNSHTTQLSKHLQFITLPHVHVVTLTTSAWRRQHRFLSELSFLICCRTRGHLQETYTRMSVLLIYSTNHSCWYFFFDIFLSAGAGCFHFKACVNVWNVIFAIFNVHVNLLNLTINLTKLFCRCCFSCFYYRFIMAKKLLKI